MVLGNINRDWDYLIEKLMTGVGCGLDEPNIGRKRENQFLWRARPYFKTRPIPPNKLASTDNGAKIWFNKPKIK